MHRETGGIPQSEGVRRRLQGVVLGRCLDLGTISHGVGLVVDDGEPALLLEAQVHVPVEHHIPDGGGDVHLPVRVPGGECRLDGRARQGRQHKGLHVACPVDDALGSGL